MTIDLFFAHTSCKRFLYLLFLPVVFLVFDCLRAFAQHWHPTYLMIMMELNKCMKWQRNGDSTTVPYYYYYYHYPPLPLITVPKTIVDSEFEKGVRKWI
jgi:hypothetical protein